MKMKKLLIIIILFFPVLVHAYDQSDDFPWSFGWSLGIASYSDDIAGDNYNDGVTGSLSFDFHLQDYFAFGMRTGFLYFENRYAGYSDAQIGYFNICASFYMSANKHFRPFIFFGPGIYSFSDEKYSRYYYDGNTVYYDRDSRQVNAGLVMGTGFDVMFGRSFGVTVFMNYHRISATDPIDIIGGELGLKYYF